MSHATPSSIIEPTSSTQQQPPRFRTFPPISLGIYVIFAVVGMLLMPHTLNPDAISYISVARDYLAGDFHDAINAYWSPLYSWLLVPLLALHILPVLATKILGVIIGLLLIRSAFALASAIGISPRSRTIMGVALIPLVYLMAVRAVTADALNAALVLLYLAYLSRENLFQSRLSGAIIGLLAGLAYLAKAYSFGFFLLHFAAVCIYWAWSGRAGRWQIVRHAVAALLVLGIIVGAWMVVLQHKYGYLTAGTAGKYNYRLMAHEHGWASIDHFPMYTQGFLPPPNARAVSTWEDPSYHVVPPFNPLASKQNLRDELTLSKNNFIDVIKVAGWYSKLSLAVLLASLLIAGRKIDPSPHRPVMICVLTVLLYPLGYIPIVVEPRYMLLIGIVLLVLGLYLGERFCRDVERNEKLHLLFVAIFCASFAFAPSVKLWKERHEGQQIFQTSQQLASLLPPGARVASNGNWADSLYLCFYRQLAYFGQPRPAATPAQIADDLKAFHIQYFIVWNDPTCAPFPSDWEEITHGQYSGALSIYKVPQQ